MSFDENSDILTMSKYEYMVKYINENEEELKENGMDKTVLLEMLKEYYDKAMEKV